MIYFSKGSAGLRLLTM